MKEIREIGIEKELFLIDENDNIMEPKLYGFPRDEFEFLVEIRSLPSDRFYPVYTTLQQEELQYNLRANKFGMYLKDTPSQTASNEWVNNHWNRYKLHKYNNLDFTKNIYKKNKNHKSHHLGVMNSVVEGKKILTAGVHVHFSSRDSTNGEVIELPIEDIVRKMDESFEEEVYNSYRNLGEWESKAHGFEYRSLPCNVDIYKVLKKAFEILRNA